MKNFTILIIKRVYSHAENPTNVLITPNYDMLCKYSSIQTSIYVISQITHSSPLNPR